LKGKLLTQDISKVNLVVALL